MTFTAEKNRVQRRSESGRTTRNTFAGLTLLGLALGGCQTLGTFPGLGASSSDAAGAGVIVTFPGDPAALGQSRAEQKTRNALDLVKQKRFAEARQLLAELRDAQLPRGESFRAFTASMAVISLREGDIAAFRRLGRQLANALDDRTRIDPNYVDIVGLYRAVTGDGTMPVNASAAMLAFKHTLNQKTDHGVDVRSRDRDVKKPRPDFTADRRNATQ